MTKNNKNEIKRKKTDASTLVCLLLAISPSGLPFPTRVIGR